MKEFKEFSLILAKESAKIIKSYFRCSLNVELKKDKSEVTIADKKSEELMRNIIMKEYPDHGILGEEFGSYNDTAEYVWTLDPIDGTTNFICGAPLFGTLIALLKKGQPVLGVINLPVLNEFLIGDGKESNLNDKKVELRECNSIRDSFLLTTDHLNIEKHRNGLNFEKLIRMVRLYRTFGDCYGYYLLATGYADIMIDPIMHPWDSLPLIPIIQGAGGIITDYQGNDPLKGNSIVASSKDIHNEIIHILNNKE